MKDLIRKILKESKDLDRIKENEILVPKIVPFIIEFIKQKYGDSVRVQSYNKGTFFGSDNYRGLCKEIKIYVEDENLVPLEVKTQVWNDIKSFFNIDMSRYGACLDLTVYRKSWEKV